MLGRFADTYAAGVPELDRAATPEERTAASHASHSLRGSSATVGATTLVLALLTFEAAIKAGKETSDILERGRKAQELLGEFVGGLLAALRQPIA